MIDVSEVRFEKIYKELGESNVDLDPDPLEFGPDRLSYKVHLLDKFIQRVSTLELQLSEDHHVLWRDLNMKKSILKIRRNELMISDIHVRKEPTKGEREARADLILKDENAAVAEVEIQVQDLERVLEVVRTKKKDLKDTEKRLHAQMRLVQETIRMGQEWNRKSFLGTTNSAPKMSLEDELREVLGSE